MGWLVGIDDALHARSVHILTFGNVQNPTEAMPLVVELYDLDVFGRETGVEFQVVA